MTPKKSKKEKEKEKEKKKTKEKNMDNISCVYACRVHPIVVHCFLFPHSSTVAGWRVQQKDPVVIRGPPKKPTVHPRPLL